MIGEFFGQVESHFIEEVPAWCKYTQYEKSLDGKIIMRNSLEEALQARIAAANMKSAPAVGLIPRRQADIVNIPLSSGQHRLWYMAQIEPDPAVNNAVGAFRLIGPLDIKELESALNEIVQRHEVLRTELRIVDEAPTQQICYI